MKNRLFIVLALLFTLVVQEAWTQPVTQEDAKQIAAQFLKSRYARHSTKRKAPAQTELTTDVVFNATDSEGQPYLYAVSTPQRDGFVLVSGDERFVDVLGYSERYSFDEQKLPENMRAFLQGYIDEMKYLQSVDYQPKAGARRAAVAKSDISPLVTTKWNQEAPYNDQCPLDDDIRSVTGCVATAMAQVVNYYIQHNNWPTALMVDIPGYTTLTKQLSVPSIASTAPFPTKDLLKDTYNTDDNRSDEEKNAVATLMYYCGASVQMNYTSNSSGAQIGYIPNALINYFGFDTTTRFVSRSNYTYADWVDLLYGELAAGRPIVLGGDKANSSHVFLTDGFDAKNTLFHINWGWGGYLDEYFALSVMNPDDAGPTGAAKGTAGFTINQYAIIGVQHVGASGPAEPIHLTMNNYRVEGQRIRFSSFNDSGKSASFDIGLGVYDGGTITLFNTIREGVEIDPKTSYPNLSTNTMCADYANQTRKLIPLSRVSGTDTWIPGANPDINYFTAEYDAYGLPTLTLHPAPDFQNTTFTIPANVFVNTPTAIKVTFTNNGEDYCNRVYFFVSTDANNKGTHMAECGLMAAPGRPTSVEFEWIPASATTYHIWATTDEAGSNVIGTASVTATTDASLAGKTLVLASCTFTGQDDQSFRIDDNGVRSIDIYNGNELNGIISFMNLTDADISGTLAIRLDKYNTTTSEFELDTCTRVANNISFSAGATMNALLIRDSYAAGYMYRIRILLDGECMDDRYRINLKNAPEAITNTSDWETFCANVKGGTTYSGQTVRMTADITTSTWMEGTFEGVFDGNGHTLTITIPDANANYLAPFRTISGATIKNLTLAGSLTSSQKYGAGLVGQVTGDNNHIENCVVNTDVNLNEIGGGVVGQLTGSLTVKDVLYGGTITQANHGCKTGGFIGDDDGSNQNLSMTNCFYTTTPATIDDEDVIISADVMKASQLTLGPGVTILSGNTCYFHNEVYYYGTVTLGYNDPEAVVTYSLDGTPLSGNSFTISEDNAAFNDGSATITASYDYRISYNLDGGTVTTPNPTTYTSANEDITLNNPTRDGWTFIGWTGTDLDDAQMSVTIPQGSTGHRHYTATWTTDELATDASGAYLINNKNDWDRFCTLVNNNEDGYYGKTVKLTADIGSAEDPVTTKAGRATDEATYCLCGLFDGQGHTLYVKYINGAPFLYSYFATIQNLHVAGDIIAYGQFAAGLVSEALSNLDIRNCRSSINISSRVKGDGTHGGLVSVAYNGYFEGDVTITGCLFDGSFTTDNGTNNCGGFIGWLEDPSRVAISNSFLAPVSVSSGMLEKPFARNYNDTDVTTNSYYIPVTNLPTGQGKQANTITAGEYVTSLAISGTPTEYDISGITAYEETLGLKYNGKVYAGSEDVVNLALTSAEPEQGSYFYQYTTSAGSISTNSPTSATLIMPDGPTTINASFSNEEPTGINTMSDASHIVPDAWYTIDGRKFRGKPTASGVYLNHGKKVVIK